jgi:hypothetical protein
MEATMTKTQKERFRERLGDATGLDMILYCVDFKYPVPAQIQHVVKKDTIVVVLGTTPVDKEVADALAAKGAHLVQSENPEEAADEVLKLREKVLRSPISIPVDLLWDEVMLIKIMLEKAKRINDDAADRLEKKLADYMKKFNKIEAERIL